MRLVEVEIKPQQNLWTLFGGDWPAVYNAPYNKSFRDLRPDPHKICAGDRIYKQICDEDIVHGDGRTAFIVTNGFMGDDIATTAVANYFKSHNFKVIYMTHKIWSPLFGSLPIIDEVADRDRAVIAEKYKPNDIVVCPFFHNAELQSEGYAVLSSAVRSREEWAYGARGRTASAKLLLDGLGIDPTYISHETFISFNKEATEFGPKDAGIVVGSKDVPKRRLHYSAMDSIYALLQEFGWNPVIICNDSESAKFKNRRCFECRFFDPANLNRCVNVMNDLGILFCPNSGLMHVRAYFKKPMIVPLDVGTVYTSGLTDYISYCGLFGIDQQASSSIFANSDGMLSARFSKKLGAILEYYADS